MGFEVQDMTDMKQQTALVTGANTGLGFEMARAFAAQGTHVVVGGRNASKVQAAITKITEALPNASLEAGVVDLNSLASVRDFAAAFRKRHKSSRVIYCPTGLLGDAKTTIFVFAVTFDKSSSASGFRFGSSAVTGTAPMDVACT